jgi:hypothetical protein
MGAASDCKSGTHKYQIKRSEYEELQKYINEGHQPWRTDAPAVAGSEILNKKGEQGNAYGLALTLVRETEREATYNYVDLAEPNVSYRITLKRFKWLLPLAQSWQQMVWAPVEMTIQCHGSRE